MSKIYLASSWRNPEQPETVKQLRLCGHEVYDFRNPKPGDKGFAWSAIDPEWQGWNGRIYREKIKHPIACAGFKNDWDAMVWADTCVLLLPCGRSAHIEAGYFVGAGKRLVILLADQNEPELMYKMTPYICCSFAEVLDILK